MFCLQIATSIPELPPEFFGFKKIMHHTDFMINLHSTCALHISAHAEYFCSILSQNLGFRLLPMSLHTSFNPIALRKAKNTYNFGLSECHRVKYRISSFY